MDTISVKNEHGQVTHFSVTGPNDPRAKILNQRIGRGDLEKVSKSTKTGDVTVVIIDDHAGKRDEKGDLLKSVHGGGKDPDADGDAVGQPSGSKAAEGTQGSEATGGYGDMKHADLQAEVDRRNEGREENARLNRNGSKAELAQRLQDDDTAAQA